LQEQIWSWLRVNDFIRELRRRNVLRVGTAYMVVGWLVLQFIDVVFPILSLDDELGRPILYLLLAGLPVTLILAWVFELTPDGIKKEKDVDRENSVTANTGRFLDRSIIVVLIFAIGLLLVDKFVLQEELATSEIEASVAVLPFVNMSGDQQNEYFSDGLTETLLHMLAQLPDLKVAARTSSFSFKNTEADIRDIAVDLGVATILEGSVQRSGDTVRITAQLIEADTGFHLWSKTFDRDLDDIFSVQDEIATSVVDALQLTLLGGSTEQMMQHVRLATNDASAYEKYLMGLEQKNIASYGSLPRAEGLFKEALSIDPDFCEAKVELAFTYSLQAETGLITADDSRDRIRPLIDQVLTLKPNDGRALGLLAAVDWREAIQTHGPNSDETALAEEDLNTANELAPNDPEIYAALSIVSASTNQDDDALDWLDKGLEIDPLSARLHLQRGRMLLGPLDEPELAEQAFAKGQELAPEWTAVNFALGDAAFAQGRFADGINWYRHSMTLDPQDHELPASISRFYYQFGLSAEGDDMFRRAQALAPQEAWIRSLELEQQIRANNHERAVTLAKDIINDDVENRGGAYSLAVRGYVSSMIQLGKADAVAEFFESVNPGITSSEYVPSELSEVFMQFMLVQALVDMGSYELSNKILTSILAFADRTLPDWRDDNEYTLAALSIAQGNTDAAIEYALKDLDQPFAKQRNWSLNYQKMAWFKPILKDKRVAQRIAELEIETQAAGDQIRAMLAEQG
jgi:TolB-like protein/Tfp pilus assembly protein PilF